MKSTPYKILLLDDRDHLVVVEWGGNIEIVNIHDWQVVQSFKLPTELFILDIAKLETPHEYALAITG